MTGFEHTTCGLRTSPARRCSLFFFLFFRKKVVSYTGNSQDQDKGPTDLTDRAKPEEPRTGNRGLESDRKPEMAEPEKQEQRNQYRKGVQARTKQTCVVSYGSSSISDRGSVSNRARGAGKPFPVPFQRKSADHSAASVALHAGTNVRYGGVTPLPRL